MISVYSCRGADCYTDQYLVIAELKEDSIKKEKSRRSRWRCMRQKESLNLKFKICLQFLRMNKIQKVMTMTLILFGKVSVMI
jgi:hypothetical protein